MLKSNIFEWIEAFFEALALAAILFFLFWPILIDGASMQPTFYSGNRVIISRILAYSKQVKSGDIVVCKLQNNTSERTVIKRVIGIPNDSVVIKDGKVYLNGALLDEPYLKEDYTSGNINIILGKDEYYVLGDNRKVSFDSRRAGAVNIKNIDGKVILKWFPFDEMKLY